MKTRPVAIITVLCAALALVVSTWAGCGGKKGDESPAGLCKTIYKERVDGSIIPFKEEGPKHKDEFLAYCETLPVDYLKCEAKDMFKMSDSEATKCRGLLEKHQHALNLVLTTGKPTEAPSSDTGGATEEKAAAVPDELPTKAKRGDDLCSTVCGKSVDVEYDLAKVMLKTKPDKLRAEIDAQVKKEAECNRRCNNHVKAGGAHKELVEKINTDCADKADFSYAECIGKINMEWRKNHTEGNNAIQWGYDEPCDGKWNGCDEGE